MDATLDYFERTGHFGALKEGSNMPANLSLEQQLPRYTPEQAQRRAELMANIARETKVYRRIIADDERELAAMERAANT